MADEHNDALITSGHPAYETIHRLADGFGLTAFATGANSAEIFTALSVILSRALRGLNDAEVAAVWSYVHNSVEQNVLLMQKHDAGRVN